jgi:hypothetical protein
VAAHYKRAAAGDAANEFRNARMTEKKLVRHRHFYH